MKCEFCEFETPYKARMDAHRLTEHGVSHLTSHAHVPITQQKLDEIFLYEPVLEEFMMRMFNLKKDEYKVNDATTSEYFAHNATPDYEDFSEEYDFVRLTSLGKAYFPIKLLIVYGIEGNINDTILSIVRRIHMERIRSVDPKATPH
jgi:hypothetical protein